VMAEAEEEAEHGVGRKGVVVSGDACARALC